MASVVDPNKLNVEVGDSGLYNPTVVIATTKWQIVSFGYGFASSAIYVTRIGSTNVSTWVDIDTIGANPSFSDSEIVRLQDAADLALSCAKGG